MRWGGLGCRVAVPSQGDPVVAISCISHPSSQATAKAQAAAPAAELQLEGVTGEDEGLDGGLEGDLEDQPSGDRGPSPNTGGAASFVLICIYLMWTSLDICRGAKSCGDIGQGGCGGVMSVRLVHHRFCTL